MYRITDSAIQVLLAHPGGRLFRNKDNDTWSDEAAHSLYYSR